MPELDSYKPSQQQEKQLDLLLAILKAAEKQDIQVYVVGGYGLDALYGQLTRDHGDFDLYIHDSSKEAFTKILNNFGFFPTGNLIGVAAKMEFSNSKLSKEFTIEFGIFEKGLMLLPENDRTRLLPTEPLGVLDKYRIWTPTLEGFKKIIEINNMLAVKNNDPEYSHREWMRTMLTRLDQKFKK